ncbi:RidA family protein [Streptomyces sp. NPDC006655]|uniref:RidA family protein n=1 Tax=Streptomyces sp. NPDC006655 TaxID=3156898 RepID=UPI003456CFD2
MPSAEEASGGPSLWAVLDSLGLRLPPVSAPKGRYVPAVVTGDHLCVAGQVPLSEGELLMVGRVGAEVSVAQAQELSRWCALTALAAAHAAVGIDRVTRVVKVTGYVACAPGFTTPSRALDGASDLYNAVFRARGGHARSDVGVAVLPLNSPVEVETLMEITRQV